MAWWFFLYHPTCGLCFTSFEWSKACLVSILHLLWLYFSHGMQATCLPPGSQQNTIILIGLHIVPNSTMWQNWFTGGIKIWACSFGHCVEYLVCRWGRCTQGVVQDAKDEVRSFESLNQLDFIDFALEVPCDPLSCNHHVWVCNYFNHFHWHPGPWWLL